MDHHTKIIKPHIQMIFMMMMALQANQVEYYELGEKKEILSGKG